MDYKEKYQKALERAKKGLPIDEVFPELKGSEDERVRKEIVDFIYWAIDRGSITKEQRERSGSWLAYLEKQNEQERIVPEREATDFEIEVHEIIAQARSDKRLADKDVLEQFEKEASCALMWKAEKQKEQKPAEHPAKGDEYWRGFNEGKGIVMDNPEEYGLCKPAEWSEEDKKKIERLRSVVNECAFKNDALDVNGDFCEGDYAELDKWLKSLKDRGNSPKSNTNSPSWKPTEKQIAALEWMLTTVSMKDGGRGVVLKNLVNDLKKQM